MINFSSFCMNVSLYTYIYIHIKGKKSNTTDLASMCDGHVGDGILARISFNTPSVGSRVSRDIAAVGKKIISTMSTIIS